MKFGEMKYDVPFEELRSGHLNFGFFTNLAIAKEGKRLYKLHPEYKYLDEDTKIETDGDFYRSVVYAYMVDQILKNNPEATIKYRELADNGYKTKKEGKAIPNYWYLNDDFLRWYKDYLRERSNPGILAREEEQRKKELQDSINQHAAFARMEEEQHLHAECPYCHSKNTEKIGTISRAVSISLAGAASSKLGKQWHCNNCKSDF